MVRAALKLPTYKQITLEQQHGFLLREIAIMWGIDFNTICYIVLKAIRKKPDETPDGIHTPDGLRR